jgi:hypothetical protein
MKAASGAGNAQNPALWQNTLIGFCRILEEIMPKFFGKG